jgi:hypothetical protein
MDIQQQLLQLEQELKDGDITQQGYEKKRTKLLNLQNETARAADSPTATIRRESLSPKIPQAQVPVGTSPKNFQPVYPNLPPSPVNYSPIPPSANYPSYANHGKYSPSQPPWVQYYLYA